MGREGKVNFKRNSNKMVQPKENVSDDSDEDYVVENEENASDYDSEDSGKSLDGYASEESIGSFIEEEEEEEEREIRKVSRVKKKRSHVKNGKINGKTTQKRKKPFYEYEEEDYVDDEDYVYDDDDDDDDEEFTPDEDEDCLFDDEESFVKKKNSDVMVGKKSRSKKGSGRSRKRRRKSNVLPKPATKKRTKVRRLKKKERIECDNDDDGDFIDNDLVVGENRNKNSSSRRKKYAVYSDSDCVASSGSSDYEYTISEEEREQVKEASKLCGDLKTNLRSSGSVKKIEENGDSCHQTKPSVKKGKEKIKEVKPEVGKQVCGVCLSEEDKRRFRGTLDCCSHYFCYTCIVEWSKVESRCPLCKQRFTTITKNGRSTTELDLRNMVIQVPKRDQVYQPSEEEIRSFIDPYENVICTECHEGGDDGLMLLCDLCDSPAHTYCVGLGQQVPEGNWYCDGCRPVALGSSSSQAHDILSDQRTTGNNMFNRSVPSINLEEAPDTILESSPCLVSTQGLGLSSPRLSSAAVQTSPSTGAGAPTLSDRRRLHRHIQNIMANRMSVMGVRTDFTPASNIPFEFPNSQSDQGSTSEIQIPGARDMGLLQHPFLHNRLQNDDHSSSSIQSRDISSFRVSLLRRQMIQNPPVMTTDQPANLTLWPGLTGVNSVPGYEQFNQNNNGRSTVRSDGYLPSYINREQNQFYVVKEHLQSIVKSHLTALSQEFELGNEAFKDIAKRSTHTILAACGLDHKPDVVAFVPQKSCCNHVDRLLNGQASMMKGLCSSCFDAMARDVVKRIMEMRIMEMRDSGWLSLGL